MEKKLESLISGLNKKYKKEIVIRGTDLKEVDLIQFSSPRANYLTRGGIAVGKMVEFFGAEGSGKTTTSLDILANFQRKFPEKYALYLDAENSLDKEWGEKMGVDWTKVLLIKPENESAEMLLDMVMDAINSGDVGFVVVDSIPFLVPKSVLEGSLEDKHYAGNSTVMTQFVNKVCPLASKNDTTIIMINQIRDKIGVPYTAYNTPGGRALKHAYVQRVYFRKGKLLDENYKEVSNQYPTPIGNIVEMKLEKNKVTKNDRKVSQYTLHYDKGIDLFNDTVDMSIYLGIVVQSGAWYNYTKENGEVETFQGKSRLLDYLTEQKEEFRELYQIVNEKVKTE